MPGDGGPHTVRCLQRSSYRASEVARDDVDFIEVGGDSVEYFVPELGRDAIQRSSRWYVRHFRDGM